MSNPTHRVLAVRRLTDATVVLRIERHGFAFLPGQHTTLGVHGSGINREYSIYSAPDQPCLEFLVHVRKGSRNAALLSQTRPGDVVDLAGPYGEFVIPPADLNRKFLFVATGVGIAPFHCLALAHPGFDYQVLHGVRRLADRYDHEGYPAGRYLACVSGQAGGDFHGRVDAWLAAHDAWRDRICYLCGHAGMVAQVYEQLRSFGVPSDRLVTEVFFQT